MTEESMTFEKLEMELPNGFHDAEIRSIGLDYLSRTADLRMNLLISVGTPEDRNAALYRAGTVRIAGLLLLYIEPPDPNYPFVPDGSPLNASGNSVKVGQDAA